LIRARTDDGRKRAKARGVRFGRPQALTTHQRKEAIQRLAEGAVQADLARSYGVSQATISRLAAPSPFEASEAVAAAWRRTDHALGSRIITAHSSRLLPRR